MIRSATPVLRTGNYPKARDFYVGVLGFRCVEEAGEPAIFGIFRRDGAEIFVHGHNGADAPYDHWRTYFTVEDVDALAREVQDAGGTLSKGVAATEYGMREFEVTDPDGNVLCFGAEV
ncbi:MAG: glyoxalase superfamily protein [Pseudomonadota bacterium]